MRRTGESRLRTEQDVRRTESSVLPQSSALSPQSFVVPQPFVVRVGVSFRFAWLGIRYLTETQSNWRVHLFAGAAVCALAIALRVSAAEAALLALTIGLVLALEAMNTAIEATLDAAEKPPALLARRAKDSAAAGVLIGAIAAVVVGALVLGPKILALV